LMLTTAYGFLSFHSWWKRLVMVASALPLAVFGNLLRMLCIIFAAEIGGQSWGDYVHEGGPLGLISLMPYVPAVIGGLLIGRFLKVEIGAATREGATAHE